MKEIRCKNIHKNKTCNNLLLKVDGNDYVIETMCRKCGNVETHKGLFIVFQS